MLQGYANVYVRYMSTRTGNPLPRCTRCDDDCEAERKRAA